MKKSFLSKEKLGELQNQLRELKTTKRFDIAERLKRAKEYGDLSENFEYSQAKEDQEKLEREILEIEYLLKNSEIITKSKNKDVVSVGLTVTLKGKNGALSVFTIVGSQESDPKQNRISNVSPVGKTLIGKKAGEKVSIKTPKGVIVEYEIIKIE